MISSTYVFSLVDIISYWPTHELIVLSHTYNYSCPNQLQEKMVSLRKDSSMLYSMYNEIRSDIAQWVRSKGQRKRATAFVI